MRRLGFVFVLFCILLYGCIPSNGPAPTLTALPASSAAPTATLPPISATPTPRSLSASATRTISPTETITPLPTIATFTPTFDARTIVTATPAPKAECPKENPEITPDFPECDARGFCYITSHDDVLSYLNSGGSLDKITDSGKVYIGDLTGDGLREIIWQGLGGILIDGCKGGKYQSLLDFGGKEFSDQLEDIVDLNKDGILEIIFASINRYGYASMYFFEWDGGEFRSLIQVEARYGNELSTVDGVSTLSQYKIVDINGDSLKEIVIADNWQDAESLQYDMFTERPFRDGTITLGWNGQHYVNLTQKKYTPPQYRFQAIQDGDWAVHYGRYQNAMPFYQEAVFSDKLEWWSPERKQYEIETFFSKDDPTPTVYPTPVLDSTEYPRLAAYAYYRMVILHTFLGEMDSAQVKYDTLQKKFPSDSPGHPYVEMAAAFWDAHQSSRGMYNACAAAIAYADEHPEILSPFGGGYHGFQSLEHAPADVCPFR